MALWRTRAWPGPGAPTSTSSTWSTSGPPCLWYRTAFAMPVSLLLGLHCLERRLLQLEALDRELDHVEVHIEPCFHRAQVGDSLFDLLRIEGGHRHAGNGHTELAPQAAVHL